MIISILGAGWLGKALIFSLKEKNFIIHASTRTSSKLKELEELGAISFLIDYTPDQGVIGDATFFKCDCLIICMAPGRNSTSGSIYLKALNSYLVKAAEAHVNRIIFTSSTSVYAGLNGVVNEDLSLEIGNKPFLLKAEDLLREQINLDIYILRLAGLIGMGRHPGKFLAGKKALPNPEAPVNLIEQSDVVTIIRKFIEGNYPSGIYNICNDDHPKRKEFYDRQTELLGLEVPEFAESGDSICRIVSNEKVKKVLGFKFKKLD